MAGRSEVHRATGDDGQPVVRKVTRLPTEGLPRTPQGATRTPQR